MPKYLLPTRYARFENGVYRHYEAGTPVELSDVELRKFPTAKEAAAGNDAGTGTGDPATTAVREAAAVVAVKRRARRQPAEATEASPEEVTVVDDHADVSALMGAFERGEVAPIGQDD